MVAGTLATEFITYVFAVGDRSGVGDSHAHFSRAGADTVARHLMSGRNVACVA